MASDAKLPLELAFREVGLPFWVKRVGIPPDFNMASDLGLARIRQARLPFALYVRNDNRRPRLVKLIAACGALAMDDPQPAITVMMPDED